MAGIGVPPKTCPEPRFFPPSQNARQGIWSARSLPLTPLWVFGDQSSSGASLKMMNSAGELKMANQDSSSPNRQENCSAATRPKSAWTSIRILPRAWGASAALRSLMLQASVTKRYHFSGLGPLLPTEITATE